MPRTPTFPPYPRKPHKSGLARIKLAGKDVYLGPHNSPESWREYERRLTLWRAGGRRPPAPGPAAATTVADVCTRFLAHAETAYAARGRTYQQYKLSLKPLCVLYGPEPAAGLDAEKLEAYQRAAAEGTWLSDAERARYRANGWAPTWSRAVIARRTGRVKTVWKWAEKKKLVPAGSSAALRVVDAHTDAVKAARKVPKRPPATWEKVQAVLPFLNGDRRGQPAAAMLLLQWWTGMRTGEVCIMRHGDIDFAGPVIDGRAVWVYRPAWHKNDWRENADELPRQVPLGPECQAVLAAWLRPDDPAAYLFPPSRKDSRKPYYNEIVYAQAVARAAGKAGVDLQPYDCRHGAKMRITKALGADAARAFLGQKSIESTTHYGVLDVAHAAEIARKLA